MKNFEDELKSLLNRYSKENASNTPDFILAEYLMKCLDTYSLTVQRRDAWYSKSMPLPPSELLKELDDIK